MDCKVCFLSYDSTSRKPLILPCGHTFCAKCLEKSVNITTSKITCPKDRKRFPLPNGRVDELLVNFAILETLTDDCCDCKKKPQEHPCLPEHCSKWLCSDCRRKHLRIFRADLLSEIDVMKQDITQKQAICDDNSKLTEMVDQSTALIAEVNQVFDSEKNKFIQTIKQRQVTDSKEYLEWKKVFNLRLAQGRNVLDNIASDIQSAAAEPSDQDLMDLMKQIALEKEDIAKIHKSARQLTKFKPSVVQPELDKMMPVLYQKITESAQPEACVPSTTPTDVLRGRQTLIPDYKAATFSCSYGKFGSGAGEFNRPWGISTSPLTGNLAISDWINHRIQIMTPELQPITVFGKKGSGDNEYNQPTGITFSTDGSLFICDTSNHRIQHVREDGTFINKFGSYGAGDGQLNNPNGICWDRGLLYICDRWNHRVQVMEESGVHVRNIGSKGSAPGQFPEPPFHVAVSTQHDKLVVSDFSGNLHYFAIDGQHKKTIKATEQPHKMNAGGIAIDKQGHVIIHDYKERHLVILSQIEEGIATISLPPGELMEDSKAVTITHKGDIVVCDWQRHRLVKLTVPQIKSD